MPGFMWKVLPHIGHRKKQSPAQAIPATRSAAKGNSVNQGFRCTDGPSCTERQVMDVATQMTVRTAKRR